VSELESDDFSDFSVFSPSCLCPFPLVASPCLRELVEESVAASPVEPVVVGSLTLLSVELPLAFVLAPLGEALDTLDAVALADGLGLELLVAEAEALGFVEGVELAEALATGLALTEALGNALTLGGALAPGETEAFVEARTPVLVVDCVL
jgi:hypothetical protein